MPDIPEPVKVSPIIKFFRYSFLIAGIAYGASKLKALQILEDGKKEEREQRRRDKEIRLAQEKEAASQRDIAAIVAIFSGKSDSTPEASDQSYTKQKSSLEPPQEVVHDIAGVSDDLSTCTVEKINEIIRDDKEMTSTTTRTEYGSGVENETEAFNSGSAPVGSDDVFSSSLDLSSKDWKEKTQDVSDSFSMDSENAHIKREGLIDAEGEDIGYFVETFSDRIPYVETESSEDFLPKNDQ